MSIEIYARFFASKIQNNAIFDLNNDLNRDNCFLPYYLLREKFKQQGIQIDTPDISRAKLSDFELQMDVQSVDAKLPCYLLMLESPQVLPANGKPENWKHYRKIFTWRDDLVDGNHFIKINFPNSIVIPLVDGWRNRDRFCCVIAGNKSLPLNDERDLYKERIKTIRWFEKNAADDFDLYGIGWDVPAFGNSFVGKVLRRLYPVLKLVKKFRPFPSYRGRIEHKRDVLIKTRFSICYENVCDLPGYITEKIFDSFFSGCVPIYWGANNVKDYIPEDCFVDRREFKDTESLYHFLKTISEHDYMGYQKRIASFLSSDAAKPFSSEAFAETIVSRIVKDLED